MVQSPNYMGLIEEQRSLADAAHAAGALFVVCANPLALALILRRASSARISPWATPSRSATRWPIGGPYVGYMAAREALLRRMPGRIVGAASIARAAGPTC